MSLYPLFSPAAAALPVAITYQDDAVSSSTLTTYTFSSMTLGSGTRTVVWLQGTKIGTPDSIVSVTIDGNTATEIQNLSGTIGGNSLGLGAWEYEGSVGATGNVVVTWVTDQINCLCTVYKVDNAKAATAPTITTDSNTGTTALSTSPTVVDNGAIVSVVGERTAGTWTWTELTEDHDTNEGSNSQSGASKAYETGASPTVTATPTATTTRELMITLAYGPA